jgi:hypothetical protein
MTGLTAWQGLFEHGRLRAGQSVLVHGAAGAAVRWRRSSHVRPAPTSSAPDALLTAEGA